MNFHEHDPINPKNAPAEAQEHEFRGVLSGFRKEHKRPFEHSPHSPQSDFYESFEEESSEESKWSYGIFIMPRYVTFPLAVVKHVAVHSHEMMKFVWEECLETLSGYDVVDCLLSHQRIHELHLPCEQCESEHSFSLFKEILSDQRIRTCAFGQSFLDPRGIFWHAQQWMNTEIYQLLEAFMRRPRFGGHVLVSIDVSDLADQLIWFGEFLRTTNSIKVLTLHLHGGGALTEGFARIGETIASNTSLQCLLIRLTEDGNPLDLMHVMKGIQRNLSLKHFMLELHLDLPIRVFEMIGDMLKVNTVLRCLTLEFQGEAASDGIPFIAKGLKSNTSLRNLVIERYGQILIPNEPLQSLLECLRTNRSLIKLKITSPACPALDSIHSCLQRNFAIQNDSTAMQMCQ